MSNLDDNLNQLHEHRKALEEEYRLAQSDPLKLRELTRSTLTALAPQAVETLENLLVNGVDSLRFKAAAFVIEHTLEPDSSNAQDELSKLIGELTNTRS